MINRDAILEELKTLPRGYISNKTIKGKTFHYLQYREGKKIVSQYVPEQNVPILIKQIDMRAELERLLADYIDNTPLITPLCKSSLSLTGDIMEQDEVVATFKEGDLIWMDKDRAPLIFKRSTRLEPWLKGRAIDSHRTHSRLLKKALRIVTENDEQVSLYVHAVTLTDDYWFRPQKSKLHYKEVSFTSDLYSDLALNGNPYSLPSIGRITPELTTVGSFEKCWKRIDGQWYMLKKGTGDELFSECFCSELAKALDIPTARYFLSGDCIWTPNFAMDVNFEPMSSIAGEDDRYEHIFPLVSSISEDLAKQYLLLVFFDCLVNNIDRHNENCGFLRNRKTGKIISLAPNFDNNIALTAVNGYPHDIKRYEDGLINIFKKFLRKNKEASRVFSSMKLPTLTEDTIKRILSASVLKTDEKTLVDYLMDGYKRLEEIQNDIKIVK